MSYISTIFNDCDDAEHFKHFKYPSQGWSTKKITLAGEYTRHCLHSFKSKK